MLTAFIVVNTASTVPTWVSSNTRSHIQQQQDSMLTTSIVLNTGSTVRTSVT